MAGLQYEYAVAVYFDDDGRVQSRWVTTGIFDTDKGEDIDGPWHFPAAVRDYVGRVVDQGVPAWLDG